MNIYLIRHAQPDVEIYSDFPGPKLSVYGHKQATTISAILKLKNILNVYSSEYTRSIETAKPFLTIHPNIQVRKAKELGERMIRSENHKNFAHRVETWFAENKETLTNSNTAIFGHCGTINVILFHLDSHHDKMQYPFQDEFRCLTPLGGVWELSFSGDKFIGGKLIHDGKI